jgi:hypothetical protein
MQEVLLPRAHHRAGALGATHSPRMKNSRGIGLGGAGQGYTPSISVGHKQRPEEGRYGAGDPENARRIGADRRPAVAGSTL